MSPSPPVSTPLTNEDMKPQKATLGTMDITAHEPPASMVNDKPHSSGSTKLGASKPSPKSSEDSLILWTSPLVFRLCWFGFFLFHATCFAFLVSSTYIYRYLPDTTVMITLENLSIILNRKYLPFVSVCMALLAVMHGFAMASMVLFSLVYRRFTYFIPEKTAGRTGGETAPTESKPTLFQRLTPNLMRYPQFQALSSGIVALFGRKGIFGIEGRHFLTIFLCRELLETCLQGYQAYRLAAFVPQPWLVRYFVALLVFSCWTTPLIHRFLRRRPALQRVSCLVIDVMLDFASTVVISTVLGVPYLSQYNTVDKDFSKELKTDSRWRALMQNEFRLIVVSSWIDLFSRVTLMASTVSVLHDVKQLLRMQTNTGSTVIAAASSANHPSLDDISKPRKPRINCSNQQLTTSTKKKRSLWTHRFQTLLQAVIAIAGVVMLILHITAESYTRGQSCMLPVSPWDSAIGGCAYVSLNCTDLQILGTETEINTHFSEMDPKSLQTLDLRSCPQLHIPATFREFHELCTFKIVQSNLIQWDSTAAFTVTDHPVINYFEADTVQFPGGQLPLGFIDAHFPPSLLTIFLMRTNLAEIPDTVGTVWPSGLVFACQFSQLTAFPSVILQNKVQALALSGNKIPSIPAELLFQPALRILFLIGNPIEAFPEVTSAMVEAHGDMLPCPALKILNIAKTKISAPPAWLRGRRLKFIATGSPLCERIANGTLVADEEYLTAFTNCATMA